ncbi:cytochrome c oxidase assembly protein [Hyphomicrobium sp. D-2]|uniref:cytochrome c oxidase assembly protein n=1 Tax=Hyphomicrobium sp. D-2 TaxID=3041621 RepID=UPI0024577F48|nr:cytochrome c oxidase assembly protein [Hyphomicrobium sp. D-2]MDH4982443.1 cytochrome c oxidase assembly protein [Hyphomicrobium sp. D-2]
MDEINAQQQGKRPTGRRDGAVALICGAIVVGMIGASFAAVPLYRLYCQVTGYGGTTQRAETLPTKVLDRIVRVHFDANVAKDLPWTFEPAQPWMDVKVGENNLAFYRATNTSDRATTGTSIYNVTPDSVGRHFSKVQCFCFNEQRLEPGQSIDMPVSFFVDPEFVSDEETGHLSELTLSYTFYPVTAPSKIGGQAGIATEGRGG